MPLLRSLLIPLVLIGLLLGCSNSSDTKRAATGNCSNTRKPHGQTAATFKPILKREVCLASLAPSVSVLEEECQPRVDAIPNEIVISQPASDRLLVKWKHPTKTANLQKYMVMIFPKGRLEQEHELVSVTGAEEYLYAPPLAYPIKPVTTYNAYMITVYKECSSETAAATPFTTPPAAINVAWMAYTWGDTPAPWTKGEIESVTLTNAISVKKLYEQASFGRAKVTGQVYGPYTISTPKACFSETAENETLARAKADGYVAGNFTNIQYVFPTALPECNAGGSGWPVQKSWISMSKLTDPSYSGGPPNGAGVHLSAHELAHNFRVQHAEAIWCSEGPSGTSVGLPYTNAETGCESDSGNPFDTMNAGGQSNNFNAREKLQLGWWEPSQVETITKSGNYTIRPDETNVAGIHLFEIKRTGLPIEKEYYYLEFHQPTKPFSDYTEIEAANPERWKHLYGGAFVLLGPSPGNQKEDTHLLYTNPTVVSPVWGTQEVFRNWEDQAVALPPGKTYEDSESHLKIKTESVSAAGVVVKVTF